MKKTVSILLSFVFAFICIIPLAGCSNEEEQIKNLMTEFEYSCNTLDVDGILDCIHPDVANKIKGALGVIGLFTGNDRDDILDSIASFISDNGNVDSEDFFKSIEIDVTKIEFSGSTAKVNLYLKYKIVSEYITSEINLICEKYNEKWYIKNFSN